MLDGLNDRLEGVLKPLGQRFNRLSTGWKVITAVLLVALGLYVKLYLAAVTVNRGTTPTALVGPPESVSVGREWLTASEAAVRIGVVVTRAAGRTDADRVRHDEGDGFSLEFAGIP